MAYLKDYMKKIVKYLEDNNRAAEVDTFKKNINGVMKGLLGKFSDLQFYQGKGTVLWNILLPLFLRRFSLQVSLQIFVPGESMNPAAMVALIDYREIDGEERPVMIASSEMSEFWQHIA